MRNPLTLALAAALGLTLACSEKKDEAPAGSPVPSDPPAAADPEKPTPQPATPVESPPPEPTAAAPTIDCDALLTPDDVAKACGEKAEQLAISKGSMETGSGAGTCMRSVGRKGDRIGGIKLAVNTAPGNPEGAQSLVTLSRSENSRDIEVGDKAIFVKRRIEVAKQTDLAVEAARGRVWFKVGVVERDDLKKALTCSEDGLIELGKTVASRLP